MNDVLKKEVEQHILNLDLSLWTYKGEGVYKRHFGTPKSGDVSYKLEILKDTVQIFMHGYSWSNKPEFIIQSSKIKLLYNNILDRDTKLAIESERVKIQGFNQFLLDRVTDELKK